MRVETPQLMIFFLVLIGLVQAANSSERATLVYRPKRPKAFMGSEARDEIAFDLRRCRNEEACGTKALAAYTRSFLDVVSAQPFEATGKPSGAVQSPICRDREKETSAILSAPYMEDVRYCTSWDIRNALVYVQVAATITVTKNVHGPYRIPTETEKSSYRRALESLYDQALAGACRSLNWKLVPVGGKMNCTVIGGDSDD